jgi:hypothetical protein
MAVACASIANLKQRVWSANAGIAQFGVGASVTYDERALAQITTSTEQLALELDAQCAQYNACAIDAQTWLAAETQLQRHVELVEQLQQRPEAATADAVWVNAVPRLAAARLQARFQVQARGADGAFAVHESGATLYTGDAVRFALQTNSPCYAYIVLMGSDGIPQVVFPMPRKQLDNPVPPNVTVLIPPIDGGLFMLDKLTGREHVQVLVSERPLPDIENVLRTHGAPSTAQGRLLLEAVGRLICDSAEKQRNLVLDPTRVSCGGVVSHGLASGGLQSAGRLAAAAQAAPVTLLRPPPNDSLVVFQHEIDHRSAARAQPRGIGPALALGADGFLVTALAR